MGIYQNAFPRYEDIRKKAIKQNNRADFYGILEKVVPSLVDRLRTVTSKGSYLFHLL